MSFTKPPTMKWSGPYVEDIPKEKRKSKPKTPAPVIDTRERDRLLYKDALAKGDTETIAYFKKKYKF